MRLVESYLTKNPCYKEGRTIIVKGLMLHSVGCPQPNALAFIKDWNRSDYNRACVHAFIDGNDGTVYQTLPWHYRGWHCGAGKKGSGNDSLIGIEMCEPACIRYTGGANFTCSDLEKAREVAKRTYDVAVELFAKLCKEFGLNPLEDGVIISHSEGYQRGIASNHADPEHLWKGIGVSYTMEGFRKEVKNAMIEGTQAFVLKDLSEKEVVERIGRLASEDMKKTGILASVTMAQFTVKVLTCDHCEPCLHERTYGHMAG